MQRIALLIAWLAASPAAADGKVIDDQSFAVAPGGPLTVDGGVVVATPAALPSGLATGLGVGVTRVHDCRFSYGARLAWTTVTESSLAWTVSHDDVRLHAYAAVRHQAGRGSLALRLALGPTIVHEVRTRNQADRSGRTELDTRATAVVPAIELGLVAALHVRGAWLAMVTGGPALTRVDGELATGWSAGLGIGWRP